MRQQLRATRAGNSAGRKLMIEYTMLRDINDTEEDAARLADLTADLACKVNLITFNPHQGTRFQPSPMEQVLAFRWAVRAHVPGEPAFDACGRCCQRAALA